ncbi:MAG: hypothetical protein E6899_07490 [Neisseria sp.]|nr:hypothetical protein [Neisseria sp.]
MADQPDYQHPINPFIAKGRLKIFRRPFCKPTIPQHSRLKADAEPYRHSVVKYSGLTLNQDKARQRRTGLKLSHYKTHLKHRTTLHPRKQRLTVWRQIRYIIYAACAPHKEPHEKTHLLPPQL